SVTAGGSVVRSTPQYRPMYPGDAPSARLRRSWADRLVVLRRLGRERLEPARNVSAHPLVDDPTARHGPPAVAPLEAVEVAHVDGHERPLPGVSGLRRVVGNDVGLRIRDVALEL